MDAAVTGGRRFDRALVAIEALVGLAIVAAVIGKSYGPASTAAFVVCGTTAAMAGYFILRMFGALGDETLDVPPPAVDDERARLEHEKLLLLQGIKELEADAAIGKVDAEDYAHLRRKAEARALAIIRALKESDT